jgi:hypothetical protein
MHEDEALGTRFAKRLNELWGARGASDARNSLERERLGK